MGWGSLGRIAAGISTGGLSEVARGVSGLMKKPGDTSNESDFGAKMNVLGQSEMDLYNTATLSPEQKTTIAEQTAAERAQMRQKMADTGMVDSSTRLSGESMVSQDQINMQETTLNNIKKMHWDQAMKAYGMSDQSSQVLAGMNDADRQAAMAIISGVAGAGGQIAGSMRGTSTLDDYTKESTFTPTNSTTGSGDFLAAG